MNKSSSRFFMIAGGDSLASQSLWGHHNQKIKNSKSSFPAPNHGHFELPGMQLHAMFVDFSNIQWRCNLFSVFFSFAQPLFSHIFQHPKPMSFMLGHAFSGRHGLVPWVPPSSWAFDATSVVHISVSKPHPAWNQLRVFTFSGLFCHRFVALSQPKPTRSVSFLLNGPD